MLTWAIIAFALTACVGILMGVKLYGGDPRPQDWAVPVHGILAAIGFGLLVWELVENFNLWTLAGAGVIVAGGLLGLVLLSMHNRREYFQMPVVTVHAVTALVGFVLLLLVAYGVLG